MPEFEDPIFSNVKVKIDINSNGNIAADTDTTRTVKFFTIAGISATSNLEDSMKVFDTFIGQSLGGGRFDEYSAIRTITQGVN